MLCSCRLQGVQRLPLPLIDNLSSGVIAVAAVGVLQRPTCRMLCRAAILWKCEQTERIQFLSMMQALFDRLDVHVTECAQPLSDIPGW